MISVNRRQIKNTQHFYRIFFKCKISYNYKFSYNPNFLSGKISMSLSIFNFSKNVCESNLYNNIVNYLSKTKVL